MEMPEGWKKLRGCAMNRSYGDDLKNKALELMKEMAEALELSRIYHPKCFCSEQSEALKKFKEWK